MKKIVSLLIVFAMLVGMVPAVFATETTAGEHVHVLDATEDLEAIPEASDDNLGKTIVVDDYFTVVLSNKTKIDSSNKTFEDGYVASQRINFGGKTQEKNDVLVNIVWFTTSAPSSVKLWWVSGGDGRTMAIYDANGKVLQSDGDDSVKNSLYTSEFALDEAGTYGIGVPVGSNYLFKAEVTEEAASETPAETVTGTIEAEEEEPYEVEWTAPADGVLTVSATGNPGFWFKWHEDIAYQWNLTEYTADYAVTAGTTYILTFKCMDGFTNASGTIEYTLTFEAGAVLKDAYAISEQTITEAGVYSVTMIDTAKVTVVAITPSETGYYTISVPEGAVIANCGGGEWFINVPDMIEMTESLEWVCEEAGYWTEVEILDEDNNPVVIDDYIEGQTLMLGIYYEGDTVDVTVTKTDDFNKTEVELQEYVNKAALSQFELPADAVLGEYVDVYGDTHTAVLGDDGYYHLDSADGDILLVDLYHLFRLSEALEGGRGVMYAYVLDENGTMIEKWDIGEAIKAYENMAHTVTETYTYTDVNGEEQTGTRIVACYYPLTEDLIFFYDTYADSNGVYSFALGDGYNAECAWMYACLTVTMPGSDTPVDPDAEPGTEENPIVIDKLPYFMEADFQKDAEASVGVFYQFTAEKDGYLVIKDLYDDFNTGTLSVVLTGEGDPVHLTELAMGYEMKAGETVILHHWSLYANQYDLTLEFVENTEDPEDPEDPTDPEDPENPVVPDEGEWSGVDVPVTPDAPITIVFTPETDGTLTIDIANKDWAAYVDQEFGGSAYWSDVNTNPVSEKLTAGVTYTITIYAYDGAWEHIDGTITYEITFTPATEEPEDPAEPGTFVDGNNYMELPVGTDKVEYTYVATQTGTLYIAATWFGWDSEGSGEYADNRGYMNEWEWYTLLTVNGESLVGYYFGSVDVVAGETYTFVWEQTYNNLIGWDAILNLSYSDELVPKPGTADMPYELWFEDVPTETVELAPGESVYYQLYNFDGSVFTVSGGKATVSYTAWNMDSFMEQEYTHNSVNGVVTFNAPGYTMICITNTGDTAAVFTLNASYPEGSYENPDELEDGDNNSFAPEGDQDGYYYTWISDCYGTLTLTFSGDYWGCVVSYLGVDLDYTEDDAYFYSSYNDETGNTVTFEVVPGTIVRVAVYPQGTYDEEGAYVAPPATTITVTADIAYEHTYGEPVHHDAACGKDAYTEYTCSVCGHVHTDVEEGTALEHNYVDGKCTLCGAYDYILGDVNGDNEVNIFDANVIAAYANELLDLTEDQLAAADVNGDGEVNIFDANLIAAYANELIDSFPAEG